MFGYNIVSPFLVLLAPKFSKASILLVGPT
jgi:hypothetical protein